MQTLGTYQSDHVAPPAAVVQLLNGSTYQTALGANAAYAPQAFQFTLPDIFFQLDNLGEQSCNLTHAYLWASRLWLYQLHAGMQDLEGPHSMDGSFAR